MNNCGSCRIPSLVKKYLMAISGLVLVLFVFGHMAGNLLFFAGPEALNAYAHKLHSLPGHPYSLWAIRLGLLFFVLLHVVMAVALTRENRQARPVNYQNQKFNRATYAARTMPMTGLIILSFIIFHILQFTVRVVPEAYDQTIQTALIKVGPEQFIPTFDVYAMVVAGFSSPVIALSYAVATGLLCLHLAHGVASMFQSIGLRNELWRGRLNRLALVYGWVIFLGFASIPLSVLLLDVGKPYLESQRAAWQTAQTVQASGEGATINFQ